MVDLGIQKIHQFVGADSYTKGLQYPKRYVKYTDKFDFKDIHIHQFQVESERTYDFYEVEIHERACEVLNATCTCLQYQRVESCKHIAACLLQYKEDIFVVDPLEKSFLISKGILEEFYQKPTTRKVKLKKQLTLALELEFHNSYYGSSVYFKFKIGEEKLYSLNNKLSRFLANYDRRDDVIEFGKNFTYDPEAYFFSKEDEEIIYYLVALYKRNPYYNYRDFSLSLEEASRLFSLLSHKTFSVVKHGEMHHFLEESPIAILFAKEGEYYRLSFQTDGVSFLTNDYQYAIKEDTLYQIPSKISRIIQAVKENKLDNLIFKKQDLSLFHQGILPIVQNDIILDDSLKDEIVLGVKPAIKIYLDLKNKMILCNVKLQYQEEEIDYFDSFSHIVRDEQIESQVIEDLLKYGFLVENKKIYIDDVDVIGEFLTCYLEALATDYEVFTSEKVKKTNILKDMSIRSSFSIGQDNIMKYEFDLGDIHKSEIGHVLDSMRKNKKYYRLKNGHLLDLSENHELKQLQSLINDMELTDKDLQNGNGSLPKYRAIYLDSIKKEQYHIIQTDNLFDELIYNFNSYKDERIQLSPKEKKILRDYQEIGVKWLYNIYKCGFGGILADEMGLGKSIQLIYFLKQVLKEKRDAKILIVAPTALIYNWKNEFDKFGREMKYKVFAESRVLRKKELERAQDINVFITTYGLLKQDQELYSAISFDVIAIDEAQNIKNANSQMTKIVKSMQGSVMLALTGTPLENSVLELWSIFDFIMPGYLSSYMSFQKKYNVRDVDKDNLKLLDNLNQKIQPFILRRRKKDVVTELPEKLENNIYIDLTEQQKKLYVAQLEKTKKEMDEIIATEGFRKGSFKILQLLTKLRQLCIDPRILYENYKGGSAKIENLVSLVEEVIQNGHKILLFTSYKTALDIVNREFTNRNISTYVIDGSVSSKKRMELVDKFNQDDTNVFLITLKAGGTGLNLTSADVVIHLDLWWNPQVENQATDRAHRIGQKNTVEVIKLICKGTIEERILELQNKKKVLSDKVIEGDERDQNILSRLTEKDIQRLLSLDYEDV